MFNKPPLPTDRLSDQSLRAFVEGVGSRAAAPGSGAAAAVTLALAAACAAKAFTISARHSRDDGLEAIAKLARGYASLALEGAQRDADDFRAWLHTHDILTVESLREDARILSRVADDLMDLIEKHQDAVNATLRPDLDAARDLILAFDTIERRNLVGL